MSKKKRINPLGAITKYFKEVKAELKKVVWPTFAQIKNNTIIVIISLIFVGGVIWVFDLGFAATLGRVVDRAPVPQENLIPNYDDMLPDEGDFLDEMPELPPQNEDDTAAEQNDEQ
ncbi:MAG: preprotein translocase subunit SecE [Firmicutes bacterium]|nr:preprotein translocase subunit SecE [Bacillota bacterium]